MENIENVEVVQTETNTIGQAESTPTTQPTNVQTDTRLNFEELENNKEFQSYLDRKITQASTTSATNAVEKYKKAQEALERTREQARHEKADFETLIAQHANDPSKLMEIYKIRAAKEEKEKIALQERISRQDEVRENMTRMAGALEASGVPKKLFELGLDYFSVSSDDLDSRFALFNEFEFYPKGTFEQMVAEKTKTDLDNKLKQTTPEATKIVQTSSDEDDEFMRIFRRG